MKKFRLPRKKKKEFKHFHLWRYGTEFMTKHHYNYTHYIWMYYNKLYGGRVKGQLYEYNKAAENREYPGLRTK